jgi:hypothetical protein
MQNIFVYYYYQDVEIFMCYIFTIEEWDKECHVSYRVETNSANV